MLAQEYVLDNKYVLYFAFLSRASDVYLAFLVCLSRNLFLPHPPTSAILLHLTYLRCPAS